LPFKDFLKKDFCNFNCNKGKNTTQTMS